MEKVDLLNISRKVPDIVDMEISLKILFRRSVHMNVVLYDELLQLYT